MSLTGAPLFRRDQHHPVTGTRTVKRSSRSILQHLDRLDHRRVKIRQRVSPCYIRSERLHRHPVHHVKWSTGITILTFTFY